MTIIDIRLKITDGKMHVARIERKEHPLARLTITFDQFDMNPLLTSRLIDRAILDAKPDLHEPEVLHRLIDRALQERFTLKEVPEVNFCDPATASSYINKSLNIHAVK